MTELQQTAISYTSPEGERPAWAIFPLKPDGKTPLLSKAQGGHGCKDATLDREQVEKWWAAFPKANIGIATGATNGIVVIDIDNKPDEGRDGLEALKECEAKWGKLPDTMTALTAHGGTHYYFTLSEETFPLPRR